MFQFPAVVTRYSVAMLFATTPANSPGGGKKNRGANTSTISQRSARNAFSKEAVTLVYVGDDFPSANATGSFMLQLSGKTALRESEQIVHSVVLQSVGRVVFSKRIQLLTDQPCSSTGFSPFPMTLSSRKYQRGEELSSPLLVPFIPTIIKNACKHLSLVIPYSSLSWTLFAASHRQNIHTSRTCLNLGAGSFRRYSSFTPSSVLIWAKRLSSFPPASMTLFSFCTSFAQVGKQKGQTGYCNDEKRAKFIHSLSSSVLRVVTEARWVCIQLFQS